MENDEHILRPAAEMISGPGCEVETARDGMVAAETCRRAADSGEAFEVIMLDLEVPGGAGAREAVGEILRTDPEAKALVTGGYSTDPVMTEHKKHGFQGAVKKPYNIKELAEVLHRLTTKTG